MFDPDYVAGNANSTPPDGNVIKRNDMRVGLAPHLTKTLGLDMIIPATLQFRGDHRLNSFAIDAPNILKVALRGSLGGQLSLRHICPLCPPFSQKCPLGDLFLASPGCA